MKRLLLRTSIVLLVAVAVAGAMLAVTSMSGTPVRIEADGVSGQSTTVPLPVPTTTTTTVARTTTTTTVPPTTTSTTEPSIESLRPGDRGQAVLALQTRLRGLGYWLGTPDGSYGYLTEQAVTAFQKAERLERDGIAGPSTRAALEHAARPTARSTRGDLVEVDKARQLLLVIRDGKVAWAINVSTGTERPYKVNGRTELADTPVGRWEVGWAVDGVDVGELGPLYRPRYFHEDGIAVHGYADVPPFPASHGCVRVTEAAMDWIWSDDVLQLGSVVWVY